MKALRLMEWKSDPVLTEVPEPVAGPGEAVIRIGGAGACHSDVHLMRDFEPGQLPWNPPFTLGHENAGWIHRLGAGASGFDIGQPVAVYGPWGCGRCERCLVGSENYCENPEGRSVPHLGGGLGVDGGMAEFMLVPSLRHLVPLPEGLSPLDAAPLTDAGLTSYHAVRRSLSKLPPGSSAVVIGVGGLGHLAIQVLKATTAARVIALDTRPEALKLANAYGADQTIASDDAAAEAIRAATKGRGADVVLDFVGSDVTMALGSRAARSMGDLTVVGIGGGSLSYTPLGVAPELSIQHPYWGSRPELVEVLDLAARGMLRPQYTTFPLDKALDAYASVEAGTILGRAVIEANPAAH
ncbi:MAG: NAD(P)-dependent alcohol dehydrogenase [Acidimicrobiales bacterium]